MRLKDKVAVITGGSRGIGLAIAEAYLNEGANVVIASRKQPNLDEATEHLKERTGKTPLALATHTGDADAIKGLVDAAIAEYGKLDIAVNNAATNPHFGPILSADAGIWQKTLDVNVMGYFWLCKFAAEAMQNTGGGKLINVTSVVAFQPGYMMGVYSVSKAGVLMLTKVLAQELAPDNIQVNAIAPGFVKTRFSQALWDSPDVLKRLEENTPAGRMGEPDEIAGGAVFLASDESSFMTGHCLTIDGGVTLTAM